MKSNDELKNNVTTYQKKKSEVNLKEKVQKYKIFNIILIIFNIIFIIGICLIVFFLLKNLMIIKSL